MSMVKDIPNAKIQIMDLLKIICNHQITQNKQILDEDNSFELSRVLENYISNPKHKRQRYTMPPESSVAEMETREGLGPFDKLSDIDLWIDGEPSDLTAVFRIKTSACTGESTVFLYGLKVL